MGTEPSTRDLDAVRSSLRLVDTDSLSTYEQPDIRKVAEIVVSLRCANTLFHPVIVDPDRKLLIDGHHRVKAFQWLGLKRIPAYTVDYLSCAVGVAGWNRVTDAGASEISWAFDLPGNGPDGPWSVLASDSRREVIARRRFREAAPSAQYLDLLSLCIEARGFSVALEPSGAPVVAGRIHSYVDPIVGKAEVLDAIGEGRLFPHEVNRHLVDSRPLAMHIPLDRCRGERDFKRCVEGIFENGAPVSIDSGLEQAGRLYEERVTMFTERKRGL
jgi:ParB-like nuclease domain